jgi:hypothetical protein
MTFGQPSESNAAAHGRLYYAYTRQERHSVDTTTRALTRLGLVSGIGESESIEDVRQWFRTQLQLPQAVLAGTALAEIA